MYWIPAAINEPWSFEVSVTLYTRQQTMSTSQKRDGVFDNFLVYTLQVGNLIDIKTERNQSFVSYKLQIMERKPKNW